MQLDLSGDGQHAIDGYDVSLGQYMTPSWVAEAVVHEVLADRDAAVVLEPSCGIGRFLSALPESVTAIGVEIDPRLATIAARTTGRTVVTGDFRTVDLPVDVVDLVIGNPPFRMDVFDGMLARCDGLLREGGEVAMILPAFTFQTSSRVARYNRTWTISQQMLPRNLFPGIRLPLVLGRFVKDAAPKLFGFLLYQESREVEEMPAVYRRALAEGRSGWRAVVEAALANLGGEGTVAQVCAEIAPRRPTATEFWRPKVRQQLSRHFHRKEAGRYALAA